MAVALLVLLGVSAASGWLQITLYFFGIAWMQDLHAYSSHTILALIIVHVLGVLLMCFLLKENLVRAMVDGKKRAPKTAGWP